MELALGQATAVVERAEWEEVVAEVVGVRVEETKLVARAEWVVSKAGVVGRAGTASRRRAGKGGAGLAVCASVEVDGEDTACASAV